MWEFWVKRLAIASAVALFAGSFLVAQEPTIAQVLVINCYPSAIDLQLGDQPVFSVNQLAAASPTAVMSVPAETAFPLYFKLSSSDTWRYFLSGEGGQAGVTFAGGRLTVIRIDQTGGVELIDLTDLSNDSPAAVSGQPSELAQVFFMNAAGEELSAMQLVDPSLMPVAEVATIPGQAFTGLVSIVPGQYAGLLPANGLSPIEQFAATPEAVLQLIAFQPGERYAVLAWGEGQPKLSVWHIGARP